MCVIFIAWLTYSNSQTLKSLFKVSKNYSAMTYLSGFTGQTRYFLNKTRSNSIYTKYIYITD